MPPVASVRARTCQDTVTYLESVRPGSRAELDAMLRPGLLDEMFAYTKSGFVPLELDAAMGQAVLELLGPEEARRFWIQYTAHHMESPLLGGLVRTAIKLLGARPVAFFKWMPRALGTVFHDAFEVSIETLEPGRAVLRFDVTSDVFLRTPVYSIVLEAIARAIYSVTNATGDVAVVRDTVARTYRINAQWHD